MQMWESQWVPAATDLAERGTGVERVCGGAARLGACPAATSPLVGSASFRFARTARFSARASAGATSPGPPRAAAQPAAELAGLDSRLSGAESYSRSDGLTAINRVMLASALDPLAPA